MTMFKKCFLNIVILHLSACEDGTECSETSAYKIQMPGNYPEENIQKRQYFLPPVRDQNSIP